MSERTTVDGKPVSVGDVVWTSDTCGVRQTKMTATHLGSWWTTMVSKQIYSTERAALQAAISRESAAARKAKQEVKRAEHRVKVYKDRLDKAQRP